MLGLLTLLSLTAACLAFPTDGAQEGQDKIKCGYLTCGANSRCGKTNGYDDCICLDGFYGSAHAGCTSEPQCVDDSGCQDNETCNRNLCGSPCFTSCPADVGCRVKNHVAECIFDGALFFDPSPSPPETTPAAPEN